MPLSFLSPSVRATPAYSEGRRAALEDELSGGGYRLPDEVVISHQELDANRDEAWTSFVAIDVCGSTPLRAESATKYDEAYALFFRELGTLVGQFNCRILKHTGDGLIAYIDHSSHNAQADNIIDFGSSALTLVREGINPPLLDAGLPAFNIRIGAEAGMAKVIGLSVPGAAYSVADFASDALNRAVKIEEGAGANEFRIGRGLYEALHVQWLVRATEVSPWRGAGHDTGAYRVD
jgi:class 3 adenylate cyclase